jgi:hypothetical protein
MVFLLWCLKCDPRATAQIAAAGGNRNVKERRSHEIVPAGGTSAANY